jgi:outer membrane lipoprotein-sorting protein
MKKYKLFIASFILASALSAQDAGAVWTKMMKTYSRCTQYSMDFVVKSIPNGPEHTILLNGSVRRSGYKFYSNLNGITSVIGDTYAIQVNENEKIITWNRIDTELKKLKNDLFAVTDTMGMTPPKVKSKTAEDVVYVVELPGESIYSKIEITLSVQTGNLLKVVYYHQKNEDQVYNRTEITYSNIQLGKIVPAATFEESKFLVVKNNKGAGVSKYSGYKIYNPQSIISSNSEN